MQQDIILLLLKHKIDMIRKRTMYGKSSAANTLLLLHCDSLTDSSMYARTMTVGNATVNSSKYKFNKSLYLTGSGVQLQTASSPFNFKAKDFTIDFWLKLYSSSPGANAILVNMGTVNTWNYGYQISTDDSGKESIMFVFAPNVAAIRIPITYYNAYSAWHHYAFVRKDTTMYAFLDGALKNTLSVTYAIPDATVSNFSIGSHDAGSSGLKCYLDELRVSNVARWTASFTAPTKPYV